MYTLKKLLILLMECIIEKYLWIFLDDFINFVVFLFKELCPEEFIHFKNKIVIKKLDARKYEESLKAELTSWIKNGNAEEVMFTHFWRSILSLLFS